MEEWLPIWRIAANILNKQLLTANKGVPPAWVLGEVLTAPHRKNVLCYKMFTRAWTWTDTLVLMKQQIRDMRLCSWNDRSLYRAGSLTAATRELVRYKLDLVGVQEVRWDKGDMVRAGDYNFFYGKGNKSLQLGTGYYVHHRIVSAAMRVEFVSDRVSYI